MIQRNSLFSIPFYKKTHYSGSYQGMRFRIEKSASGDDTVLLATYWPGPYCFEATSEEQKKTNTFPFTEDGISQACDWLNQIYEDNKSSFSSGIH